MNIYMDSENSGGRMMSDQPLLDIKAIGRLVSMEGKSTHGSFGGYDLVTALQPVFSVSHKRMVGREALVRGKDLAGRWVDPAGLFSSEEDQSSTIKLDRLCRYVHILNYMATREETNWLFLNVSPQVVVSGKRYGSFFGDLLDRVGFPPHRVVIEIIEHPIPDPDLLLDTVNYYKDMGCLIAIDDFGVGHSNFERIWALSPHIVKLDRSIIARASRINKIRRMLPGIVSLLHQSGVLVLIEGIEKEDQAVMALESNADFVQGFFFAKPVIPLNGGSGGRFTSFGPLFHKYKAQVALQQRKEKKNFDHYFRLFVEATKAIGEGTSVEKACSKILSDISVHRCYLLMPSGIQEGETLMAEHYQNKWDLRFKPIENSNNADWFGRHFLARALTYPDQLQITRPHLSPAGGHTCVTLSMMFQTPSGGRVLCCDLDWN
jgi:EAL domain-containing protein (putative c-di-GMP-specific phosphodiesterase class I)